MKKAKILVLTVLTAMFLFSLIPAAAYYPDDLKFVPVEDASVWEVDADGEFLSLGGNGAFIDVNVAGDGTLTMQLSKACPTDMRWPRIKTEFLEAPVTLDLAKTPYLYYDFTVEGPNANWAIGITLEGDYHLSFAYQIHKDQGLAAIAETDDGHPGSFKGRVDVNTLVSAKPSDKVKANGQAVLSTLQLFLIDTDVNNSGKMTVRSLYFGDESGPSENTATTTATTKPAAVTTPAKTFDPGMAALLLTGLVGLGGAGVLTVSKKRK